MTKNSLKVHKIRSKTKDRKNKIEQWFETNHPQAWDVISFILKFRIIALAFVLFFYLKSERDDAQKIVYENSIQQLELDKRNLLTQVSSASKLMDEMPTAWWKKEYFVKTGDIVMMTYNVVFWEIFMKPLDLKRWDYVLGRDRDFFPLEQALVFENEEISLYNEWLKQPVDKFGNRQALYANYTNVWIDLQGNKQEDGYYRGVIGYQGHIYIVGGTKEPKESDRIKVLKKAVLRNKEIAQLKKKKA